MDKRKEAYRLKQRGWDNVTIAEHLGLKQATVRSYCSKEFSRLKPEVRRSMPERFLSGKRIVKVDKPEGGHWHWVWTTREERAAVIKHMLDLGMSGKFIQSNLGISSAVLAQEGEIFGFKGPLLSRDSRTIDGRNVRIDKKTYERLVRYAAKRGMFIYSALDDLVSLALTTLQEKNNAQS